LEKFGVKVDGIGTTPLAGDMRLERALGPTHEKILQTSVNTRTRNSCASGEGRKKTVQDVDKIAQGAFGRRDRGDRWWLSSCRASVAS